LIRNKMTCNWLTFQSTKTSYLSCCFWCCFFLLLQYQILFLIFCIAAHVLLLQWMKFWGRMLWFICLRCLKHSQVQVDLHFGSDGSIHVSISSFDFSSSHFSSFPLPIFFTYNVLYVFGDYHTVTKKESKVLFDIIFVNWYKLFFNFLPIEKL
jgi:hypothetical protein